MFHFIDTYLFLHSAISSTLKIGAAGASKMLVPAYQTTCWHILEDPNLDFNIHGLENSNIK
jgi:hypothetical protein